jgi:tetratricopeptide (TPR) repeat protein
VSGRTRIGPHVAVPASACYYEGCLSLYFANLATTPIAENLRRLAVERKSGDLHIRSGKLAKTIFFDHGRIVFAASNLRKDRLGESLIALGRISENQFREAQDLMKKLRHRRFGEALIQSGVMDKNELGTSVAKQVRRIVLSLFDLNEGVASFEERDCPIPLDYMVSISVPKLLYDGIRIMRGEDLIRRGLGNMDRYVTMTSISPFPFDPDSCSDEEREILEHARRRVTLRRLAWAPGGLTLARLRSTYALLASGVLQVADGNADAAAPLVQMETGTFLLSALRKQPDPSARKAIRQEVDDELERSAKLDREAWLKVSRAAPKEELVRALEEKMERYHALRDAVDDDEELRTDIELVLGRASSVLRMAKGTPSPDAPTVPAAPAPAPAKAKANPPAARPAAPAAKPAPAPAPPPVAREEPVVPAPVEAPAPAPMAAEAAGEAVAASSDGAFTGQARIEHLLMEGEIRMTVSDYANAVKTYMRLVEAAPDVPAYRTRLAIAMTCWPRTAKQAEREFLEAVRLDPDNADIHYQFGLYYKAMRQRVRAVAELRTAVQLNPRHRLARQELEALSPKDSALTSLKKLFK